MILALHPSFACELADLRVGVAFGLKLSDSVHHIDDAGNESEHTSRGDEVRKGNYSKLQHHPPNSGEPLPLQAFATLYAFAIIDRQGNEHRDQQDPHYRYLVSRGHRSFFLTSIQRSRLQRQFASFTAAALYDRQT